MIHLKRFGVGLLWGAAVVLLALLMAKFPLMIGTVVILMLIYTIGWSFIK